jgi:transcription elongation factor GreA
MVKIMPDNVSYLTADGQKRLTEELEDLKGPARKALAERLRAAIQQGDLSENADYIAAKEEQGFLEGRIQELEYALRNAVIIDHLENNKHEVGIGSTITVKEEGFDEEETYYMVGPKEANPLEGRISHESPLGKALLSKKVGEIVQILTPDGLSSNFKILNID